MNLIQDVLQVFGAVREEFALNNSSKPSSHNLDYSFITPTLLALGKLNDVNVDELLHVLQGQSVLFWNLSGKSLGTTIPEKLNFQILDNPWVTPGHFTQAPSLECVFRQCYSIKAWLDLKDNHIAVLHCGNGRYRTGILMACYLKYIGAFDKSAEAFDFFCGARLKKDSIPSLSPSYRILFENVDRSTDYGGSPNPFPLHLQCLSISGLPVDEIPCVEVWDMSGLVYNSHRGTAYDPNSCSWSAEYGDGFYRVGMDIIGDFSVMCRFGGSHSLTRDKTTLIFKYQNSTAFLPPDVVELAKQNVDLNPEYADSLEETVFSMHLMFDSVDETSLSKSEFREFAESYRLRGKEAFEAGLDEISKYHSVVPDTTKFQQLAEMKFPTEYIPVALQLGNNDLSMATSIMALLLSRAQSLKGVKSPRPALPESPYHVKLQKTSLGVRRSGDKARASMRNLQIEDIRTKLFEDKAPSSSSSSASTSRSRHTENHTEREKSKYSKRERPSRSRAGSQENVATSNVDYEKYDSTNKTHVEKYQQDFNISLDAPINLNTRFETRTPPPPTTTTATTTAMTMSMTTSKTNEIQHEVENHAPPPPSQTSTTTTTTTTTTTMATATTGSDCGLCSSSDFNLRDQLVPCTNCGQTYHTKCFGGKRIPFSIKSIKERTNRDRYLLKNFADWICPNCSEMKKKTSSVGALSIHSPENPNVPGEVESATNGSVASKGNFEKNEKSYASKLFGNFIGFARSYSKGSSSSSSSNVNTNMSETESTMDGIGGGVGVGGETVNPMFVPSGKVGYKQAGSPMPSKSTKSLSQSVTSSPESEANVETKQEDFEKLVNLLASCGISIEALLSMSEEKQKETLLTVTTKLKTGAESPSSNSELTSSSPSKDLASPNATPSSTASFQGPLTAELLQKLAKIDPKFAKYSKMFQVGLPIKTIEEKIKADGIDLSQIFENSSLEALSEAPSPASVNIETKPQENMTPSPPQEQPTPPPTPTPPPPPQELIFAEDDPRFIKYFQMLKLGLPKLAVAHKMHTDGATPSTEIGINILDHKPILEKDLTSVPETKPTEELSEPTPDSNEETQVTFIEHPEFGKYFRMLKAGIPLSAVKIKMSQEGFNPDILENKPTDLVPNTLQKRLELSTSSPTTQGEGEGQGEGEMVELKDHPVYGKYFKMLKVGLPVANVRAKMEQEGYDPSILDKSPTDMVPVEIKKEDPGPGEMVPLQEHPAYGKYLRMLKVGLPLVAAKQKMIDDGFDPTVLDKGLTDLVPLDTNYRAPEAKVVKKPTKSPAAKIRKKKLHWKALDKSRVGADSVWAVDDDDDEFQLDKEEFDQLFVQQGGSKPVITEQKKKTVVNLVDPKRAQNAGIALARLRLPFIEVRNRIMEMDDKGFSADQYTSLMEYLPTHDEVAVLKSYRGELDLLGPAERYMMVMAECPDAQQRIKCILFKQQFRHRREELMTAIRRLEAVCDDVKMSSKLKKVLKTILKVGNQLNDSGEDHMGFTVDSLLKLQSQKAFDKKTSILQYVVRLISRNDESCLSFPEDLSHLNESDRLSIDQIMSELNLLTQSFNTCREIVNEISNQGGNKQKIKSMLDFLQQTERHLEDISISIEVMKTKYQSVLAYFGEEATLPSQEFFSTLEKFVKAFIEERELNERLKKAEEKKSAQEKQRRSTQASLELDSAAKASNPPLAATSFNQNPSPTTAAGVAGAAAAAGPALGDRRRIGPNGAVVARRNSSFM